MDLKEKKRRKEYGEMIRRRRRRRSLSIKEVAIRTGISQETFAKIEHGQVSPDIDGLFRKVIKAIHQEKMVIK
jgi:predicted transcriptional regulator